MVLEFIKRFFKKGPEEIELNLDDIPNFVYERTLDAESEMESYLKKKNTEFNEIVEKSRNKIKDLRDAKLRNPNIPKKELDFMEGNRLAYMKKLVLFIKSVKYPLNIGDIPDSHKDLQSKFDDFTKQSYRAYQIVSQFFGDEIQKLNKTLSRFNSLDKEILDKYKELRLDDIGKIIDDINNSNDAIKAAKSFNKDLDRLKDEKSRTDDKITKTSETLESLNSSKDNKKFNKLTKELEDINIDVKNRMHEFLTPFSSIQHALKKYSKIAIKHTEWIDGYLEEPIETLLSDDHLVLIEILENLEKNIDSLKLNEKKAARLKKNIQNLNKDFVSSFRNKTRRTKNKKEEISSELKALNITEDIKLTEKKVNSLEDRRKLINRQIEDISLKLSKIDTEPINDALIERINETFQVSLVVN